MKLHPAGREYAKFPVTDLPDSPGVLEISFNTGAWHNTTWIETSGTTRTARLLVAGPDATGNPAGTVVLALGRNNPSARLTDSPEVIIRNSTGIIDVE